MKYRIMLAVIPVVLGLAAVVTATNQAFAWGYEDGNYWGHGLGWNGSGDYPNGRYGENIGLGEPAGPGSYDNGYYAGTQDATYDHENNLVYNPVGQCLSCHPGLFWHGFKAGYDKQWNTYTTTNTEQTTSQGSSINIYGNNNYVSTNQYSSQSAGNILKSIGQGLCNLAGGCDGPRPIQESYP